MAHARLVSRSCMPAGWARDTAPSRRGGAAAPAWARGGPAGVRGPGRAGAPRTPGESLVHARGRVKRYGAFEAVRGIDIDVRRGEAFGFLGPNGAGKTSTMRMIAAVSIVSGGTLQVLGMDPAKDGPAIRARLGVCPQEDTLDTELTVRENLVVYGRFFGLSRSECSRRADELLGFVQLTDKADSRGVGLSGGLDSRLP